MQAAINVMRYENLKLTHGSYHTSFFLTIAMFLGALQLPLSASEEDGFHAFAS